ncbi:MAG: dTDP-4-dehydrorhamnose reductase [Mycobacterium sp.]|nr:dTDP-4-dehydrorhamnose reductase [Mycobacterium sp.]
MPGSPERRARLISVTQRLVITGAGGQVGRFLTVEAARRGYDVQPLSRSEYDITDAAAAERHIQSGDVVVNCAAMTNVDAAEKDPVTAEAINAAGPGNIARACAKAGARLVHISTDYVFSGDSRIPYEVGDATGPLSVYGRTKLDGERAVQAALPEAHIVRTSWVYTGAVGSDFVAVMRKLAASDRNPEVVDDQTGSPTYAKDLADALLEVVAGGVGGPVLHAVNSGSASRYEQARAVFAGVGADLDRVRPVSTAAYPRPARRPVCAVLSMTQSVRAGLTPLRPWREALTEALAVPLGSGPIP